MVKQRSTVILSYEDLSTILDEPVNAAAIRLNLSRDRLLAQLEVLVEFPYDVLDIEIDRIRECVHILLDGGYLVYPLQEVPVVAGELSKNGDTWVVHCPGHTK